MCERQRFYKNDLFLSFQINLNFLPQEYCIFIIENIDESQKEKNKENTISDLVTVKILVYIIPICVCMSTRVCV